MKLKPIKNIKDYKSALKHLDQMSSKELTEEESNEIQILSILIEDFERKSTPEEKTEQESQLDYIFDLITTSSQYEKHGLLERGLKLGEEYGELAAEILKLKEYKRTLESKDQIKQNILLEATDCLIMVCDILTHMNFTKEEIVDMAERQISKWISGIKMEK
jgi:HTH-type transcriptional regulator/antitoxin HigA